MTREQVEALIQRELGPKIAAIRVQIAQIQAETARGCSLIDRATKVLRSRSAKGGRQ